MVSKCSIVATPRERLEELRNEPRNRACREVTVILDAIGAKRRPKPGSDHTYTYPGMPPLTLPCHNPGATLKGYAIRRAIQWIEDVLDRQEAQEQRGP